MFFECWQVLHQPEYFVKSFGMQNIENKTRISEPALITRRKKDKDGINESAGWSNKIMKGEEEEAEGSELAENVALPGTLKGLSDGTWCECRHMSTCKAMQCTWRKTGQQCVNCGCRRQCSHNHPPHKVEEKQLKDGVGGGGRWMGGRKIKLAKWDGREEMAEGNI